MKTIDNSVKKREFKFSLKTTDFWALHRLFRAMRVVQGEVTPVNEIEIRDGNGKSWDINCRDEFALMQFLKKGLEYTAVVRGTEHEFDWYMDVFKDYSYYVKNPLTWKDDAT